MASDEHKQLALFIKEVHASLRKSSSELGPEQAWLDHCKDKEKLMVYADSMQKLATTHWEEKYASNNSAPTSRIKWTVDLCHEYFIKKLYLKYTAKETEIAAKIDLFLKEDEMYSEPLKLIDVGSCYNPFKIYEIFDVLAIDLCPANTSVLECDFLNVSCGSATIKLNNNKVEQLQLSCYDIVTFCFLLEYIPSSKLRIKVIEKAYQILKPGGLLIINTPDSRHVGANCRLMKTWRYTLAKIGFTRIRYEKYKHMHCMAFRKSLHKDIAVRWAELHKESYMEFSCHIPQDFSTKAETKGRETVTASPDDFTHLPFSYDAD